MVVVELPDCPDCLRQEVERLNVDLEEQVAFRTAELEASAERFRTLSDRLREADRRKDEFLPSSPHELQPPGATAQRGADPTAPSRSGCPGAARSSIDRSSSSPA